MFKKLVIKLTIHYYNTISNYTISVFIITNTVDLKTILLCIFIKLLVNIEEYIIIFLKRTFREIIWVNKMQETSGFKLDSPRSDLIA